MKKILFSTGVIAIACVTLIIGYALVLFMMPIPEHILLPENQAETRIYDRNGELLYTLRAPSAGMTEPVELDSISEYAVNAVLASEDARFFEHSGVDVQASLRALWTNVTSGEVVSGGSTITQQLVRNISGTEYRRTFHRKLQEAVWAFKFETEYSKEDILEQYLNTVYYGNQAYGIEAASRTYLNSSVSELDLAEASFLAGLPQAPSRYDPYVNFDAAKERQSRVLDAMLERGMITEAEQKSAYNEPIHLHPYAVDIKAPHFVEMIAHELEVMYDTQYVYAENLEVYTTLDYELYEEIQELIQNHLAELEKYDVGNAAVVVLDTETREILSMNGSADYFDESIDGAVNVATSLRQPGSTIKPFTYLGAFKENGFTPATILPDIEQTFFTADGNPYIPKNYDNTYHGPVRVRRALANSFNMPAVYTLNELGVSELLHILSEFGITTTRESPEHYGLSLTLGSGEVKLLELTNAYATLGEYGSFNTYHGILRIDKDESTIYKAKFEQDAPSDYAPYAYQILDIMADDRARTEGFGATNVLDLSFPVSVKTGTSRNFRDNWTMGVTPAYTVGVWVGNSDGTEMTQTTGVSGAGPIWNSVVSAVHGTKTPSAFEPPISYETRKICDISGMLATEQCPRVYTELFIPGTEPVEYDTAYSIKNGSLYIDYPPEYWDWAAKTQGWSPSYSLQEKRIRIVEPGEGDEYKIDPAKPLETQYIVCEVTKSPDITELRWELNSEVIQEGSNNTFRLEPKPGTYELIVTGTGDFEMTKDSVRFSIL